MFIGSLGNSKGERTAERARESAPLKLNALLTAKK